MHAPNPLPDVFTLTAGATSLIRHSENQNHNAPNGPEPMGIPGLDTNPLGIKRIGRGRSYYGKFYPDFPCRDRAWGIDCQRG